MNESNSKKDLEIDSLKPKELATKKKKYNEITNCSTNIFISIIPCGTLSKARFYLKPNKGI